MELAQLNKEAFVLYFPFLW